MDSNNHQEQFNREQLNLEEKQVINILINWKENESLYDLRHFQSIIAPDLDIPEYFDIKGLYFATNVLRQDLGFKKNEKPGDYDIIIIPYTENEILFDRVGVCEVKVVRPTRARPQKNANSLGITQLKGLIADGFPFISLMHVSMTEPLLDHEKDEIDFCTIPANSDQKIPPGKTIKDFYVKVKFDPFQWYSVDKQMQRLLSSDIPKYANLSCFGLSIDSKGKYSMSSCSSHLYNFQKGYFNPHAKEETILRIKSHFEKFPALYIRRVMR